MTSRNIRGDREGGGGGGEENTVENVQVPCKKVC